MVDSSLDDHIRGMVGTTSAKPVAALLEHDMSDARAKGHQLGVNPAADDQEAFSDDTLGEGDGGDDPGRQPPLSVSVLIVDDCNLTQQVMASVLQPLTRRIRQAFDGEEGVQACDEQTYDIIFMDVHMPKADGIAATKRIRQSGLNTTTPIIAFSTLAIQDYGSFGFSDMLQKPFSITALTHVYETWSTLGERATVGAGCESVLGREGTSLPSSSSSTPPPTSFVASTSAACPHRPRHRPRQQHRHILREGLRIDAALDLLHRHPNQQHQTLQQHTSMGFGFGLSGMAHTPPHVPAMTLSAAKR